MIRRATSEEIPVTGTDECLIRIASLKNTYGWDAPFIQFFTDGSGGLLSIMDGVAILHVSELTEEWQIFLEMNPDIHTLHCSGVVGRILTESACWQGRVGEVMHYNRSAPNNSPPDVCAQPYLPDVYALLERHFPGISSLNYWYPDASHRMRHGCCHIGCILRDNRVVSTAMTVAETPSEAIIGQVATDPAFRRQGMAVTCVNAVISQCKGKELYILPIHEKAMRLYQKLGFVTCGTWAELEKS